MRSNNVPLGRRPVHGLAVLVLMALTGSACAGGLAKYRNAQPLVGATPAAETATAAAGPESAAGSLETAAVTTPDTAAGTTAASAATVVPSGSGTTAAGAACTWPPCCHSQRRRSHRRGIGPGGQARHRRRRPPRPGQPAAPPLPVRARRAGAGSDNAPTTPGAPASPASPAGTTTGVTKDTVTLGFFYPKTGAYTGLARNFPAVAQAAVDEAGPINGRRVVLKFYDDGTANASTIQVEEKRAKDEAFAYSRW